MGCLVPMPPNAVQIGAVSDFSSPRQMPARRPNQRVTEPLNSMSQPEVLPDTSIEASLLEPPVLAGEGIGKRIFGPSGELIILEGLDIQVTPGDAVAIVGPSGSGKSTLLGILAGLDSPTSGSVSMLGQALGPMDEDARARLRTGKVGFVFQNFQLLPGLSALENVMLPLELAGELDAEGRARQMLEEVGLRARSGHQPLQLSGGEQQRVALARAFVSRPQLLFADEPTGNLDTETGRRVVDLMFQLRESQGAALVLVTHDERLAALCDRRLAMADGRLSEEPLVQ